MQLKFMLHWRIRGFWGSELSVRISFQTKSVHVRAAMKTQPFASIWKTALTPFPPL